MSGSRRRSPRSKALTCRDFLKRAGLGSAALTALPLVPGCGSSRPAGSRGGGAGVAEVRHGVASGDPLSDRVMLLISFDFLGYGFPSPAVEESMG